MNNIRNFVMRLVTGLMAIFLLIIIGNAFFAASIIRGEYHINPLLLVLPLMCIYIFVCFTIKPLLQKHWLPFNIVCSICILIIQIILVTHLQGANGMDDFSIRMQIASLLHGQASFDKRYFIYAANNIPITLLFTGIAKIGTLIGVSNITILLSFTQCVFTDIALFSLVIILIKEGKQYESSILLLLFFLYIPLSAYCINIYTDVTSTCFAIYGALFFYTFHKKNKYSYLILSGICLAIAYLIKMNLVIMTIGIVILIVILNRKMSIACKSLLVIIVPFALVVGGYKTAVHHVYTYKFTTNEVNKRSFPYTYWISMGLNNQTYGQHGYKNIELWNEGADQNTLQSRKQYYRRKIPQQLKELKIKGLAKLYLYKTNIMFSQGDLGSIEKNFGISRDMTGLFQYISGPNNYWYIFYSQVIYLLILLNAFIFTLKRLFLTKEWILSYSDIISIFFVGLFIFHILMWEVMPRYAYPAIFSILPIAASGIAGQSTDLKYSKLNALCAICFALCSIPFSIIHRDHPIIHNNEIVLSQLFPTYSFDNLNIAPGHSIKEQINIKSNFRKITMITDASGSSAIINNGSIKMRLYRLSNSKMIQVHNNNSLKEAGKYIIVLENTTRNNLPMVVGRTYPVDLLQKHIIGYPNCYLNFNVIK